MVFECLIYINALLNKQNNIRQIKTRSRLRQTANGRSDHVIMISPRLPFTVCRFQEMVSSFVLAIHVRIILDHCRERIIYFEEA